MNKVIYFAVFCLHFTAFAQSQTDKIKHFENGLMAVVQHKDSAIVWYNIEDRMKQYKVPAIAVAVIDSGKIVLSKTYGEANLATHRKADSTTLFHVASISKTINALYIMKLVEDGKLSLSTDIREYLRDGSFRETEFSKGEKITLANLLSHTAGINRDDGDRDSYVLGRKLPTITQIIKGKKPALGDGAYCIAKPNTVYKYSNQGICITQKIMADLFESDYHKLLKEKVLHPLEMNDSSFETIRPTDLENRLTVGYYKDLKPVEPWIFPCAAQGGLVATASDIAKAVIAIQNSYQQKSGSFLTKNTVIQMFTPQLADSVAYIGNLDVPYKNGLGVMLFEIGGKKYFTHTGSIDGYTCVYIAECEGVKGAVILLNSVNARIIPEILNSIADAYDWRNFVWEK